MPKPKQGRVMQFYLTPEELAEVQSVTQELGKGNKRGLTEHDICRLMVMLGIQGYKINQGKIGELKKQKDQLMADIESRQKWEVEHPLRARLQRFFARVKVKHVEKSL